MLDLIQLVAFSARLQRNYRVMKLQVSVKYIDVKKRTLLTCEGFQMMAWELVKHLLYMRNQIPNLYEDLHWQVQVT